MCACVGLNKMKDHAYKNVRWPYYKAIRRLMELINWIEPRSPGPCVCCCVCVCVWGVGIIKKDCEYCSSSGPRLPWLLTAAASGSVAQNTGYIQKNKALHNRKISVCVACGFAGLVWFGLV